MEINTMAYLLVAGLAGSIKYKMRYDRIVSWMMFFVVAFLFADYAIAAINNQNTAFSLLWNSTEMGDIRIDFQPTPQVNRVIIPLFFLSLLTILNNNIFRYEEKRSAFDSLIVLNFVSLSLLICSKNYIELITMVFVTDIIGYLILKDVDSSRRYVIYNFFADMCLFMILALVCGKIRSLELTNIWEYHEVGRYKNFTGILATVALFIKMGCFLFQGYLMDLSETRFQRMSAVNLLFSPLSGVLLLLKLYNLLIVSPFFYPLFKIMAVLTFSAGISGFIVQKYLRKKMVCLNMSFLGLLMGIFSQNGFVWQSSVSLLIIAVYLFNQFFFKIYLYQNREDDITHMVNGNETNALALKTLFAEITLLSALFLTLMHRLSTTLSYPLLFVCSAILVMAISLVISQIYKSTISRRLDSLLPNPMRFLSFVVNAGILLAGFYFYKDKTKEIAVFASSFLLLAATPLGKYAANFYKIAGFQQQEMQRSLFWRIFVAPFIHISRILWLMVDLFLSEKVITAFMERLDRMGISLFLQLNKKNTAVFYFILGVALFIAAFYKGIKL
ncbi:MAG: hypothetical protein J6C85_06505 [Alphaproteobacteria bacterium]|nr:hypothetical protein [Alphaproteobacteria bacterium]